jgi:hypothetical protein
MKTRWRAMCPSPCQQKMREKLDGMWEARRLVNLTGGGTSMRERNKKNWTACKVHTALSTKKGWKKRDGMWEAHCLVNIAGGSTSGGGKETRNQGSVHLARCPVDKKRKKTRRCVGCTPPRCSSAHPPPPSIPFPPFRFAL